LQKTHFELRTRNRTQRAVLQNKLFSNCATNLWIST